ncbi:hypothetical protein N7447_000221 [Penicillium robsamsonii]|uniref:uncharacterized protein n=1 Tax=Penicillium robsamsonii TaxID=1792511 RepID=UPI00254799F4|nr:uncharacterized protein N7447_000221 [Penicillium robsamsonii]KAJ5834195.1 hypothetical protein N7447_000221 [Penicillium robsamsonii]
MMTTVHGSNDNNINPFAESSTSDEHAALNTSFESDSRSSGSYPCQYEMSRQAELASANSGSDNNDIFHKVKNFLRKDKAPTPDDEGLSGWPHHGRPCNAISIFRQQTRQILSPRIIFSGAFAASSIVISETKSPALVIFIWNLLAIVPLSITLTEATERISMDLGETAGALLNITIGNLAELIIFVTALLKNNIKVVQSSLLGSILVNLLLVLGSAIIAGCISKSDVTYNTDLTHSFVGLLNLTISCLMIPSAFYGSVKSVSSADHMSLSFSRGVSIILLGTYFLYLFFQFKSHAHLFLSTRLQVPPPTDDHEYTDLESHPTELANATSRQLPHLEMQEVRSRSCSVDAQTASAMPLFHNGLSEGRTSLHRQTEPIGDILGCSCERYAKTSSRMISVTLLALSTILIAICAEFFASSFSTLNEQGVLGESFVGLIIIPIAGNVAENVTAIVVASKNQMDLAISVSLGSAIQIGLLVSPAMVLIGWALDKPMTLHFDKFEMVTLIGAVIMVDFIVLKGKTNYMEGAILCACFAAISVGAYLLPLI